MTMCYDTEIEMLLYDEQKIVSYKELANRFDITPKEAQQMLAEFIKKKHDLGKKDENVKFYITYLIIWEDKQRKGTSVSLVNEDNLAQFENENSVVSKQIYSIETKQIDDFNLIYSSDIDASNNVNRKSNLTVIHNVHDASKEPTAVLGEASNKLPVTVSNTNLASKIKTEPAIVETSKKPPTAVVEKAKEDKSSHHKQKENVKLNENKPTKQKIVEDDDDMDEMMSELCAEAEATKKSPATTIKKSPDAAAKKSPAKKPAPASTSAPAAKKTDSKAKPQGQASIMNFFKKA